MTVWRTRTRNLDSQHLLCSSSPSPPVQERVSSGVQEQLAVGVVASLPKTSPCREKSESASSSSSSCSVSDLAHLTDQYRATGRIRRELHGQPEESFGQTSLQVLTHSLKKNLNKLELFPPEQSRDSVITYTPSKDLLLQRHLIPPHPHHCLQEIASLLESELFPSKPTPQLAQNYQPST